MSRVTTSMSEATVWLDGVRCEQVVVVRERQTEMIRSRHAMMADPTWEFTDKKGHFHTFNDKQRLPTLQQLEREVTDDDPRIVSEYYHVCVICSEEVKPRWIPDMQAREVGSAVTLGMSLKISVIGKTELGKLNLNRPVSIRAFLGDEELFGIGVVTSHKTSSTGVEVTAQVQDPDRRLSTGRRLK